MRWGHVGSFGLVIVQLSVNSTGNARPPQGVPAGCDALRDAWQSVAPDMPFPPLGVPADLQSAVKKCPNLFMLWGFVIPSNQAVASQYWTA